ncbi:hypothetical protein KBX37_17640 [Micromonospora sp. U56]|uniref:hypothetical protein n=1 Tax=Micromonospora sp. U56 TaxID=2824900 RepID=UPI001B387563|nr:hypothetical protein [Micromonospora sp. U56]MBQ0894899.1 hypothetical protein [Micromonospora sp. U56]
MSDGFESTFAPLRGQQPPAPFAFPEAVRRRGRQRSQRQAVVAGLAVVAVAVAGAGAGWAANLGPGDGSPIPGASRTTVAPSGTGSPSVAPSPTTPATSAPPSPNGSGRPDPGAADLSTLMLRPADLGPGAWRKQLPSEPFSGDTWRWADLCAAYRSSDYPSLRRQADLDFTGYATGSAGYVYEHLHRYAGGWGPRALDDVRHVLTTCAGTATPSTAPGSPAPRRFTVVGTGFAGDEALLVREEQWNYEGERLAADPIVTLVAVVRVGDLVGTVMFSPDRDEPYARMVATAAAGRLAAG